MGQRSSRSLWTTQDSIADQRLPKVSGVYDERSSNAETDASNILTVKKGQVEPDNTGGIDSQEFEADGYSETCEVGWRGIRFDEPVPEKTRDDQGPRNLSERLQTPVFVSEDYLIGSLEDIKSLINRNPWTVNQDNMKQLTQMLHTIQTRQLESYFEDALSDLLQDESSATSATTIDAVLDWWSNRIFLPAEDEAKDCQDTQSHTSPINDPYCGIHDALIPARVPDRLRTSSRTIDCNEDDIPSDSRYIHGGFDGRSGP